MKDFVQCRNCVGKDGPEPGFYYHNLSDGRRAAVVECLCHIKWRMQNIFSLKLEEAGLPENMEYEYIGEKSRGNYNRLKFKYVENFNDYKKNMIYIWGPNSTQKTTTIKSIGSDLINSGYSVHYTTMNTLITLLTEFNNEEQKKQRVDYLLNKDLLIIDEAFDKTKTTLYKSGYQLPFLDTFLRERFEILKKGIIFISNTRPENIEKEGFGPSIQALVQRNTVKVGTFMEFLDNVSEVESSFEIKSLFD